MVAYARTLSLDLLTAAAALKSFDEAAATAVYLLRSTQYQFCNCGVLCISACRGRLALNQLWDRGG
jgi:predicted metal-binding membrane protein